MKLQFVPLAVLCSCFGVPATAQDEAAPASLESIRTEICTAAGVDPTLPEDEMSRAERRALRRCTRDAERSLAELAQASDANDEGLVCRRESVVGTHQRRRVCTTLAEREAARESADELLRDVTRSRGALGPEGQ